MMRVSLSILVFLLISLSRASAQEFTVMFYNVENLFDTVNDTLKNDEEFLPEGDRRWTASRYYRKLNSIARAVAVAGEWELPSLIGLCEVENGEVLRDLAYGTLLSAGNYGIVHRDSPDPRGIDLALLYRRDRVSVSEVRSWLPESNDSIPVSTRNLLYVRVTVSGDTLHLILCHLPSRRGGVLAASGLRGKMIRLAAGKIDSVICSGGGRAAVIVMGDFNTAPDDPLLHELAGEGQPCSHADAENSSGRNVEDIADHWSAGLVNLSSDLAGKGKGSYRYQGIWEMIDQVLVSPGLTDSTSVWRVVPGSFRVVDAQFLLTNDETYPGQKPFPTYGGYRYTGGYSDHLPVTVKLVHR